MHGLNLIALLVLAEGAAAADVTTVERVAPALPLARSMLKQFNGWSLTQINLGQQQDGLFVYNWHALVRRKRT